MSRSRSVTIGLILITFLTILTNIGCDVAEFSADLSTNPVDATTQESEAKYGMTQLVQAAPAASSQPVQGSVAPQEAEPAPSAASSKIQVTLTAPHFTTSRHERDPDQRRFALPLIYLHRQRQAAATADRTLEINITGLEAGVEVQIQAISRRADRSTGERLVTATRFVSPDRPCTLEVPCTVRWTLDAATTLSDFYTLQVKDEAGALLWHSGYGDRPDFVALDTWDVAIDDYGVRVYYATLFPFAKGQNDLENRLTPGAVIDFIEYVFVPMVLDTWKTQMQDWGFGDPIHPDWDRNKVVEIIITDPQFAIFDGTGPYTVVIDGQRNSYPERRIWWPASCTNYKFYDSLPNGYKVMFAHEFFHLAQWNVLLSTGRPTDFWPNVFIEAQAAFAPSVQYPGIDIKERDVVYEFSEMRAANRFLGSRLNSSYRDLEADKLYKYDAGLYWRFLYEQFNDMRITRAALEEMALHYEVDIVTALPGVMDRALGRLDGPIHNFQESLVAFARANYALRLENGRCTAADLGACGGFHYDPKGVYVDPPLEVALSYHGLTQTYRGTIRASYGMDFLEISLAHVLQDQPLKLEIRGEGTPARFDVQVWKLTHGQAKPVAITTQPDIVTQDPDGVHVYRIPQLDISAYDQLALIITRLDSQETVDPVGNYTLTLDSTG